jgi:hypothetical protein
MSAEHTHTGLCAHSLASSHAHQLHARMRTETREYVCALARTHMHATLALQIQEAYFVETVRTWHCVVVDEGHNIKHQEGALHRVWYRTAHGRMPRVPSANSSVSIGVGQVTV